MTNIQKEQINEMRKNGLGYKRIAHVLNISESTVKSYCKRNNIAAVPMTRDNNDTTVKAPLVSIDYKNTCKYCGKQLKQIKGHKERKFCSDGCRMKWWNSHPEMVNRKANYEFVCPVCRQQFIAYGNKNRKYCSNKCYVQDRFGGASLE